MIVGGGLPCCLFRLLTGIGLYNIKKEMEDRVMQFCDPETYALIEQKIIETRKDRDKYTLNFIRTIEKRVKESGFDCMILGRVKSIPSSGKKCRYKKWSSEKVYDLFAIRIIINITIDNEKSDCWKVYSLVTDIYTPIPVVTLTGSPIQRLPVMKSLHTTVIGPEGKWVEVQIRTKRMDDIAEKSTAAHWQYKSEGKTGSNTGILCCAPRNA